METCSSAYVCALDLSKAFDRVSYYRLFSKLLEVDAPLYLVKLLSFWYSSQQMQVRWNGKLSQAFGVRNGVRQGSVLSPSLFNVYVDDLLKVLSVSGYGARIADMYCGCVAYADDLTLVSPTVNGMQKLLDICGSFAVRNNLRFNAKKSVSVTFTKNRRKSIADPKFELDGESLAYMETMKHLGIVLDMTLRDDSAVKERIKRYYGAVNSVVASLGGTCSNDSVWMKVTDTQLFPVLTYGDVICGI